MLREWQKSPEDFLSADADDLVRQCSELVDADRLKRLLGRGFLLSQAVERWQARAIWVITTADAAYPRRLKERLKENAPAVLYGCGDAAILETGGLAVVGSRNATPALLKYTEHIGQLAAHAEQTIVSGGARGIDQASMCSALGAEGKVVGILADSLERAALNREYRTPLMEGKLVLVSPYDPLAGFNVGNAMQRNKLIYALADRALVISSDYLKGGTWAGAVEQLTKLRLVPVFVRSRGELGKGITELQILGARPWPNPTNPAALVRTLTQGSSPNVTVDGEEVWPSLVHGPTSEPPTIPATKPVPAKRRAKPKKSAANTDEPTLFGTVPETKVPYKRATMPRKKTKRVTDADGGNNHADD
jgi:predicted Rossmann fold nucleotide-binding protein DprA/Smf involved in DNA uptake